MLLSTKAEVQQTMMLAETMGIVVKNKRAVTGFHAEKEKKQMPYEAKGEYEFQSGGIIDTLKDLQAKFQARKDELDSQEQKAQDSFNAAVGAKREQIEADKASLSTDEEGPG